MTLSSFNITELGVFSASVLGSIAILMKQIQKSKCKDCSVCYGCVKCTRQVQDENENENDEVAVEVVDSQNSTSS